MKIVLSLIVSVCALSSCMLETEHRKQQEISRTLIDSLNTQIEELKSELEKVITEAEEQKSFAQEALSEAPMKNQHLKQKLENCRNEK